MMKSFNITGLCVPEKHYMADITGKLKQIENMIAKELYFTINRGRQYGKTTMISRLHSYLKEKYFIIRLSFEGLDEHVFM